MHQLRGLDKPVYLGHRIRQYHVRFLSHGQKHIVERTDRPDIVSIRMLVAYKKEPVMGFQKGHGLFFCNFFGVIQGKAHLSSSSWIFFRRPSMCIP